MDFASLRGYWLQASDCIRIAVLYDLYCVGHVLCNLYHHSMAELLLLCSFILFYHYYIQAVLEFQMHIYELALFPVG